MVGASPRVIECRVRVPAPEAEAAHREIARMSAPQTEASPNACSVCHADWEPGFDVCWRCSDPAFCRDSDLQVYPTGLRAQFRRVPDHIELRAVMPILYLILGLSTWQGSRRWGSSPSRLCWCSAAIGFHTPG